MESYPEEAIGEIEKIESSSLIPWPSACCF